MTNHAPDEPTEPDTIDREAATIDARSEDAPEQIEDLIEHADDLEREDVEGSPTPPVTER